MDLQIVVQMIKILRSIIPEIFENTDKRQKKNN